MSERLTIQIPGFRHTNPIPAAARVGPLLASGLINGVNPETGRLGIDLDEQCALMFQHVREILAVAGGTSDNLLRMTVWLKDRSQREQLNRHWLALFPNADNRPARLSLENGAMSAGVLVQCEITAYIPN